MWRAERGERCAGDERAISCLMPLLESNMGYVRLAALQSLVPLCFFFFFSAFFFCCCCCWRVPCGVCVEPRAICDSERLGTRWCARQQSVRCATCGRGARCSACGDARVLQNRSSWERMGMRGW
eukprot:740536-Rhodomonas_salina.4